MGKENETRTRGEKTERNEKSSWVKKLIGSQAAITNS